MALINILVNLTLKYKLKYSESVFRELVLKTSFKIVIYRQLPLYCHDLMGITVT